MVGTTAQVTSRDADKTVADFVAAISAGDHVHFLGGQTHTLTQNEDITEADVKITAEPTAILDGGGFTLTLSGNRARVYPIEVSTFTAGQIIANKAGTKVSLIGLDEDVVTISNGATAEFLSANAALKPGAIYDASFLRGTITDPILNGSKVTGPLPFSNVVVFNQTAKNFTTDFATDDRLDITAHGLPDGTAVRATTTTTLPTGMSPATTYFTKSISANELELYEEVGLTTLVEYTDDGTGTHTLTPWWVAPADVTDVYVEVFGSGGGGAGGTTAAFTSSGGGAGGVAEGFLTIAPGTSYVILVGAGGAGQTGGGSGAVGNTSTFESFSATGGGGGVGGSSTAQDGGAGGSGAGGDINSNGGGGNSTAKSSGSTEPSGGGKGGSNKRGGGGYSAGSGDGGDGAPFGGGGGGAGGNGDGGDGGDGAIIIWW